MNRILRIITLLGTIMAAAAGVAIVATIYRVPPAGAIPAITPTPPVFTATLSIQPDKETLFVGETLSVTVDIDVSQGCQYPIFELALFQDESETPIFSHLQPPVDMITGPIQIPSTWTFMATQPGTATFDARTFGERYCDDFWNWHYEYAESGSVTVLPPPYASWLPFVAR